MLSAKALPPETVNIYPTARCNLRCSMCFEKFFQSEIELTFEEWVKIINRFKGFHPRIHFSGGEPFCYSKIINLIDYIKKDKLFVHVTTNGTYLREYAKDIVRFGVNQIDISIDGPREIHDKIRGVVGTFDRILVGLYEINKIKQRRRIPLIKINSIINFENPKAMEELIKIARDFQVDGIQFFHTLFLDTEAIKNHQRFLTETISKDLNYWRRADNLQPRLGDFEMASEILSKLKENSSIDVKIFPQFNGEQLRAYYNIDKSFYLLLTTKCHAIWNTATILPSGELESCPDYIVGNCLERDFFSLWNNELMRELRQRIRGNQLFTVCRACCFLY